MIKIDRSLSLKSCIIFYGNSFFQNSSRHKTALKITQNSMEHSSCVSRGIRQPDHEARYIHSALNKNDIKWYISRFYTATPRIRDEPWSENRVAGPQRLPDNEIKLLTIVILDWSTARSFWFVTTKKGYNYGYSFPPLYLRNKTKFDPKMRKKCWLLCLYARTA